MPAARAQTAWVPPQPGQKYPVTERNEQGNPRSVRSSTPEACRTASRTSPPIRTRLMI